MNRKEKEISRFAIAKERRQKAFELRKSGASFVEIGKKLGISTQAAHQHVQKKIQELAKKTNEDAMDVMRMELERLDQMMLGIYKDAVAGKVTAVDRVLKIMDRRAKFLGLDFDSRKLNSGNETHVMEVPVADIGEWEELAGSHQAKLKREVRH